MGYGIIKVSERKAEMVTMGVIDGKLSFEQALDAAPVEATNLIEQ